VGGRQEMMNERLAEEKEGKWLKPDKDEKGKESGGRCYCIPQRTQTSEIK